MRILGNIIFVAAMIALLAAWIALGFVVVAFITS